MSMPVRFHMIVKQGLETIAKIDGKDLIAERVTVEDIQKIMEVEAYLERVMGLRFHINMVTE